MRLLAIVDGNLVRLGEQDGLFEATGGLARPDVQSTAVGTFTLYMSE